jgi:hypothetical protein
MLGGVATRLVGGNREGGCVGWVGDGAEIWVNFEGCKAPSDRRLLEPLRLLDFHS